MQIDWTPTPDKLRSFGTFGGCFLLAILAFTAWRNPLVLEGLGLTPGTLLIGGSGLFFLLAGLCPTLLKPVYIGLSVVTYPIGFVVNLLLLGLLFYGLFAPIAALFRLLGRDPLQRSYDKNAASYWQPARSNRTPESYYQPF